MSDRVVYLGSFTHHNGAGEADGISLLRQDPSTGTLTLTGLVAESASPAFLAWHPDGRYLYAVNERADGSVTAYQVSDDHGLVELNSEPSGGQGPCHVSVHPSGLWVLVANYGSGSVSVHPINPDGTVGTRTDHVQHSGSGPNTSRQEGPHAHQIKVDPSGRWVLVTDLGTDAVVVYKLNPQTGTLSPGPTPQTSATPGSGPRHMVFGAGGYLHVAGELDTTVLTFSWDAPLGALQFVGSTSAISGTANDDDYPSEIALSEDGRFCYVAIRGRDQIATLEVNGAELTPIGEVPTGGAWPRHMAVIGDYLYVANQHSNDVTAFRINSSTGLLTQLGEPLATPSPACILPGP